MKVYVREILITLGIALIIYLAFRGTVENSIVDGSSMQPGLQNGQRLIVVTAVYHFTDPQRGDVVILHPPIDPQRSFVKRIIGLPGDTVAVRNGKVYINNVPLNEPYIKEAPRYPLAPFTVPADNYFVLGDNRNNSTDSHYGWTVTRENIVGEVWLRYWPFNDWGIVRGYPISQELLNSGQKQTGAGLSPASGSSGDQGILSWLEGEMAWP
jgi:signal peptidase I